MCVISIASVWSDSCETFTAINLEQYSYKLFDKLLINKISQLMLRLVGIEVRNCCTSAQKSLESKSK